MPLLLITKVDLFYGTWLKGIILQRRPDRGGSWLRANHPVQPFILKVDLFYGTWSKGIIV